MRPVLVALLGSSNLTFGLPYAIAHLLSRLKGRTVTFFVAHGPGRSYEVDSGSLGIKFRALSRCDLLPAFEQARAANPGADARALLTDIGNDLMHGIDADRLVARVRHIVQTLHNLDTTVAVTALPIEGLSAIPTWKYNLARRIIYPTRRTAHETVLSHVNAIHGELRQMASGGVLKLLPTLREWYFPDECHLRIRKHPEAMGTWLDLLFGIDQSIRNLEIPSLQKEGLRFHCHPEYRLPRTRRHHRARPFNIAPRATVRSF